MLSHNQTVSVTVVDAGVLLKQAQFIMVTDTRYHFRLKERFVLKEAISTANTSS